VNEVIRFVSPSKHVARRVEREVELHGQTMRAGDEVVIWHSAANRDPAAFDDPDRFDVTRSAGHHLGLGAGSHYCLGASLATLELRVVLEALVDRVGDAHLLEPPRRLASTVISGYKNVRVELVPR
jgi:cytochrome P450